MSAPLVRIAIGDWVNACRITILAMALHWIATGQHAAVRMSSGDLNARRGIVHLEHVRRLTTSSRSLM